MKLVSACFLGIKCKWNGKSKPNRKVITLSKKEVLIPVCPEQLGGLPTPRKPSGIFGGTGEDVLDGKARVKTKDGDDVTEFFIKGAEETLKIAKLFGIKEAVLKQGSPSCGCGRTYRLDEKLRNKKVSGNGVTAALLKRYGIKVKSQEEL
ncbi:MAG: DUF523 domain-containing protein [Candidatus Aenigmatarchaeota archaeon]